MIATISDVHVERDQEEVETVRGPRKHRNRKGRVSVNMKRLDNLFSKTVCNKLLTPSTANQNVICEIHSCVGDLELWIRKI